MPRKEERSHTLGTAGPPGDPMDGYMTWYRDERIKLAFGASIATRRRKLGPMA